MTTQTKTIPFFARLRAALRLRKTKADNDIERPERDEILPAAQDFIFGIVMTAFLMMFAYAFMNGSLAEWIGTFLAAQDNHFGFEDRLAAFTAVCIALINVLVITGIAITREPGGGDVVDSVGDLADEINERFAELENRVNEQLARVEKAVEDITVVEVERSEV